MSTLIKKIIVRDFLSFGHNENISFIEYNGDERFLSVIGNNDTGKTNITRNLVNFLNSLWNEQKIIFDSRKYKSEQMSVITILYSVENCGDFEYQVRIDNSDREDYSSHYIKEEILKFNESEFTRKTDSEGRSVIELDGSVIDVNLSERDSILNIDTPEVSLKTGMEYLKNSMMVIKLNQGILSKEVVDFIKRKDNFNIRESICFDRIKAFIKDITSEDIKDISVTDDGDLYFIHEYGGKNVEIQESSLSINNVIEILFRFLYYKDKLLVVDGIEEHLHPLALRFLLSELLLFTKTNNLQGLVVCRSGEVFNLYEPGSHNRNYKERLDRIVVCGVYDNLIDTFVFNLGRCIKADPDYNEFSRIVGHYNNGDLASHYFNI